MGKIFFNFQNLFLFFKLNFRKGIVIISFLSLHLPKFFF
jgi:hypothetical protein